MWKTLEYWTIMGWVDISICHTEGYEQNNALGPKGAFLWICQPEHQPSCIEQFS